jgi:hypothetical protein
LRIDVGTIPRAGSSDLSSEKAKASPHMINEGKNVRYEFQLRAQCDSVSALQKCGAYRGVDGIVWQLSGASCT